MKIFSYQCRFQWTSDLRASSGGAMARRSTPPVENNIFISNWKNNIYRCLEILQCSSNEFIPNWNDGPARDIYEFDEQLYGIRRTISL